MVVIIHLEVAQTVWEIVSTPTIITYHLADLQVMADHPVYHRAWVVFLPVTCPVEVMEISLE